MAILKEIERAEAEYHTATCAAFEAYHANERSVNGSALRNQERIAALHNVREKRDAALRHALDALHAAEQRV